MAWTRTALLFFIILKVSTAVKSHVVWVVTAYCGSSTFNMKKEAVWPSETWERSCRNRNDPLSTYVCWDTSLSRYPFVYIFSYVISLQLTTWPQEFSCLMTAHTPALNLARVWQQSSARSRRCVLIRPSPHLHEIRVRKHTIIVCSQHVCGGGGWGGAGRKKEVHYVIQLWRLSFFLIIFLQRLGLIFASPWYLENSVEMWLHVGSYCARNTGLFKMIVGVLTTCHTQYTWDRSIRIFFLFNRTLQVFVTYLIGALYVHPLSFCKRQHDNRVGSKLFVACNNLQFRDTCGKRRNINLILDVTP